MNKAMSAGFLGALLALAAALPARAADDKPRAEDQSHAYVVLVGVNHYADDSITPRKHAEADAKAFYDLFTNKAYLGVDPGHVRLLLGKADEKRHSETATHENIVKALHWAATKAGKDDLFVFAFFGEGAPFGERTCYFASDSTFKDRGKNALLAAEIEHELELSKSQRFVAFLDVNFKGYDAKKQSGLDVNLANLYKEYLGKDEDATHPGRVVFLANSGMRPALESDKHGLFAQVVLDGLKGAADKQGYEPDGVVVIDELVDYLEKDGAAQIREHGKTKEERQQSFPVLWGHSSHFALTNNPAVREKVQGRLAKLGELAKDKTIPADLAEEGKNLLGRMPKLAAQRELRKKYQDLVDGKLDAAAFTKARKRILAGLKYSRDDALAFAAKVIQATQQVREGYVKELKQGELVAWAVRGLYQHIEEALPQDVKQRLEKAKTLKEQELTVLLADIRERLGRREDLEGHKDVDQALQHMLSHLDPYTTYIDAETLDRFKQETEASFKGIGISIRKDADRDQIKVRTPIKDSPAYRAGVQAGDVITQIKREVDSEGNPLDPPEVIATKGLPIDEAVKKIKGREKTKVKLVVEREGVDHPLEIEVQRDVVEVETVYGVKRKADDSWDFYIDKPNKIAYIRLTSFAQYTARDVAVAMSKLRKQGVKGLVLDLRFNPGGLLGSAVMISDLFIGDGTIVSIRPRVGKEQVYGGEVDPDRNYMGFPMAVLVNGYSASGSEIVAAALQDHHRAVVMGERSYGKGSVQTIQSFDNGKLKMTTASYWRPNGKNIHRLSTSGKEDEEWGVSPNAGYVLKLSPRERGVLDEHLQDMEIIPRRDAADKETVAEAGIAKPPDRSAKGAVKEYKDKQLDMALEYLRNQIKLAAKVSPKKAA